jgi:hypothetical protein
VQDGAHSSLLPRSKSRPRPLPPSIASAAPLGPRPRASSLDPRPNFCTSRSAGDATTPAADPELPPCRVPAPKRCRSLPSTSRWVRAPNFPLNAPLAPHAPCRASVLAPLTPTQIPPSPSHGSASTPGPLTIFCAGYIGPGFAVAMLPPPGPTGSPLPCRPRTLLPLHHSSLGRRVRPCPQHPSMLHQAPHWHRHPCSSSISVGTGINTPAAAAIATLTLPAGPSNAPLSRRLRLPNSRFALPRLSPAAVSASASGAPLPLSSSPYVGP